MSASSTKEKRGRKSPKNSEAFYVYCVGERETLASLLEAGLLPAPIEGAAGLELVSDGRLAAVVSAVPLSVYGEDALRERLTDPAWTALRAMRHEQVVEHFATHATIVPLRFGTIYLGRERIVQMLGERRAELQTIIERLHGREEWGLNIYCDRAKLTEGIDSVSPRLRQLAESASHAPPGQSYLMRKKIEALRADEVRAETKRVARLVEGELALASEGTARLRVLKDEAGEHGETVAKLAFLVARDRLEEFRAAAERLAQSYEALGFRFELTGPWPAYNFAAGTEEKG